MSINILYCLAGAQKLKIREKIIVQLKRCKDPVHSGKVDTFMKGVLQGEGITKQGIGSRQVTNASRVLENNRSSVMTFPRIPFLPSITAAIDEERGCSQIFGIC